MKRSARARVRRPRPRVRYTTDRGMVVLLEASHTLPLVDVELVLRTGSVIDPAGREGTTRLAWRMIRMGTGDLERTGLEEAIARLGARLSIEIGPSFVRLAGAVIRRNLEPFLELMARAIKEPAFRRADLAQLKRETRADLLALRDNDRGLASRAFRRLLFGDHPYGRSTVGTRKSVGAVRLADVVDTHAAHLVAENLIFAAAGDVTEEALRQLVQTHFGDIPKGRRPRKRLRQPKLKKGRRVVVVDKPARTQTQLLIGTLGSEMGDPQYYPLVVANTAFGGTFTARLMQEIREKRGWSYGAYSRVGADRVRAPWTMWTFPTATDAIPCVELSLSMIEELVAGGITTPEHRFAKSYLLNSHCFDVDTAAKRLEPRVDVELFDLPADYFDRYERNVKSVTRRAANAAVAERLSSSDLAIAIVADARTVAPALGKIDGVRSVEVVSYRSLG